jgi:tripartite-type tricarboxylate transporter receptor subunit TctC
MFTNIPASLGSIQAGKLRAIAIGSKTPSAALPDLPTIAESGLPDYEAVAWYGIEAPAGTPKDIIQKLSDALNQTMKTPAVTQRLVRQGTEPVISSPEELGDRVRKDIAAYHTLIQTNSVKIE